ncbi:MAG: restriction endonuclease subunit S [Clostridia bacterium]|nr:restriction endonuclease subunit S [Clostridia bacterium]MBR6252718.1 restriction endonuclease subunit S [Clostridia bacterium]
MKFNNYYLEDVIECYDNKRRPLSAMQRQCRKGIYPYYGAQEIIDEIDDYIFDGNYILLAEDGENLRSNAKPIANLVSGKFWLNNHAHIFQTNEKCLLEYLYYLLLKTDIKPYVTGTTQPKLNQANMMKIAIKVPEIEYQSRVVKLLQNIDKTIYSNIHTNNNLLVA